MFQMTPRQRSTKTRSPGRETPRSSRRRSDSASVPPDARCAAVTAVEGRTPDARPCPSRAHRQGRRHISHRCSVGGRPSWHQDHNAARDADRGPRAVCRASSPTACAVTSAPASRSRPTTGLRGIQRVSCCAVFVARRSQLSASRSVPPARRRWSARTCSPRSARRGGVPAREGGSTGIPNGARPEPASGGWHRQRT